MLLLCGCPKDDNIRTDPQNPPNTVVPVPTKVEDPNEKKIKDLETQIKELGTKVEKGDKDKVGKLEDEKELLQKKRELDLAYIQELKDNVAAYDLQIKDKNVEIKNAKIEAWQVKLWWASGIIGFISLVAFGVCIGWPLLRAGAWRAGAICAGIATMLLIAAQYLGTIAWLLSLVYYLIIAAFIIGLVFAFIFLRHWWMEHHTLKQLVGAIQPVKNQIKDFGKHMDNELDSFAIKTVQGMKEKTGLKTYNKSETKKK